MSKEALNKVLEDRELTGILKIHYDLADTGAYTEDGGKYLVNSLVSGSEQYGGELQLYCRNLEDNDFGTSGTIMDFTTDKNIRDRYVTKDGFISLVGNRISESGIEGISLINISGGSELFKGDKFTFIIEGGKIPRDELLADSNNFSGYNIQKPVHDREVIFSNIAGGIGGYSGWEIGLNSVNLPYFRTNDYGHERILTFSAATPCAENIWAVCYSNKYVSLKRFNKQENGIDASDYFIGQSLRNSDYWTINSGNLSNAKSFNDEISTSQTSSIKLRNFLYFDEFLSNGDIIDIITGGLKAGLETVQFISDSGMRYSITGEGEICSGISGIVSYESVISGYNSGVIYVTGEPIITELSGIVSGYEQKIVDCVSEDGLYRLDLTETQEMATTGYSIYYPVEEQPFSDPVYVESGVSGLLETKCETVYLEGEEYWEETGTYYYQSGQIYKNIYPRSVSYLGPRYANDFAEIISRESPYKSGIKTVNNLGIKLISSYHDGYTFSMQDITGDYDKAVIYLNGAAIRYSSPSPIEIIEEGVARSGYFIDKDYTVGEYSQVVFGDITFNGASSRDNLYGLYDLMDNGQYKEIIVSGTGQYSSGYLSGLYADGNQYFLNGIKLYSGAHYTISGDLFYPEEYLKSITGVYFSNKAVGGEQTTGFYAYDKYVSGSGYFENDSHLFWINGLRKNNAEYIYHDIYVDMISGVSIEVDAGSEERQRFEIRVQG